MDRPTDRETDRWTDRQTDRQADLETKINTITATASFHSLGEEDQLREALDAALEALPLEERDDLLEYDDIDEDAEFDY